MYSRKLGLVADTHRHSEGTPQAGGMDWQELMKFKKGNTKISRGAFPTLQLFLILLIVIYGWRHKPRQISGPLMLRDIYWKKAY